MIPKMIFLMITTEDTLWARLQLFNQKQNLFISMDRDSMEKAGHSLMIYILILFITQFMMICAFVSRVNKSRWNNRNYTELKCNSLNKYSTFEELSLHETKDSLF